MDHSFTFTLPGSEPQEGGSDATRCERECEEGWEKNGNHCYFWSTVSKTWDESEEICKGKGAHLASVTSKATDDYITAESRDKFTWIGGSDKESEGTWKWSDGSTWEFTNWGTIGRNRVQQPNNRPNQHCLEYQREDWKWNDNHCNTQRNFVCSKKLCSGENLISIPFKDLSNERLSNNRSYSTCCNYNDRSRYHINAFLYILKYMGAKWRLFKSPS